LIACLGYALASQPGQERGIKGAFHPQFDLSSSSSSSSFVKVILPPSYSYIKQYKQIPTMVSLRSRLVEAPATTLNTSPVDQSAHESDDGQARSVNQPGSNELSEHSQHMTAADTDLPSLLDVALASSGAMEVAQGVGADIDVTQGELNGPGIEEAEEERDRLNTASDMTDTSPATFSEDMVEDGTANSENETNNTHQSEPQLGSTETASSSIEPVEEDRPIKGQLHLTGTTGQASSSAQLKRKRSIDRIETSRKLGMLEYQSNNMI
jgi:hypothetical protein